MDQIDRKQLENRALVARLADKLEGGAEIGVESDFVLSIFDQLSFTPEARARIEEVKAELRRRNEEAGND